MSAVRNDESMVRAVSKVIDLRADGDEWRCAISDGPDDDAEGTLAAVRAALPAGYAADWTGSGDTWGDGLTTSDVTISWGGDDEGEVAQ